MNAFNDTNITIKNVLMCHEIICLSFFKKSYICIHLVALFVIAIVIEASSTKGKTTIHTYFVNIVIILVSYPTLFITFYSKYCVCIFVAVQSFIFFILGALCFIPGSKYICSSIF